MSTKYVLFARKMSRKPKSSILESLGEYSKFSYALSAMEDASKKIKEKMGNRISDIYEITSPKQSPREYFIGNRFEGCLLYIKRVM